MNIVFVYYKTLYFIQIYFNYDIIFLSIIIVIEHEDGRKDFKIVFILWAPINCKALQKMKYSTSHNAIVDGLGSVDISIQADDVTDVSYEKIKGKLLDKFK